MYLIETSLISASSDDDVLVRDLSGYLYRVVTQRDDPVHETDCID